LVFFPFFWFLAGFFPHAFLVFPGVDSLIRSQTFPCIETFSLRCLQIFFRRWSSPPSPSLHPFWACLFCMLFRFDTGRRSFPRFCLPLTWSPTPIPPQQYPEFFFPRKCRSPFWSLASFSRLLLPLHRRSGRSTRFLLFSFRTPCGPPLTVWILLDFHFPNYVDFSPRLGTFIVPFEQDASCYFPSHPSCLVPPRRMDGCPASFSFPF